MDDATRASTDSEIEIDAAHRPDPLHGPPFGPPPPANLGAMRLATAVASELRFFGAVQVRRVGFSGFISEEPGIN